MVLRQNGIRVLENQSMKFETENKAEWYLVGIGDETTGHSDLYKAFKNVPNESPKILFRHDPGSLIKTKSSFDIALAGHLHGGQVFIPGFGAPIVPGKSPRRWAQGWTELPLGRLFVTNGIGTSILPIRLGAPPEFVVLDLIPDEDL
jgi:hypothetical protein